MAKGPLQGRRVRLVVRRIEPWTVLKFSVLLFATLYLVILVAGLVLWAAAGCWYVVLLAGELRRRPRYDLRRWSTVFPLGMLPAAGLVLARADSLPWLHTVSAVLLGPALVVCLLVAVGSLRALGRTAAG